MPSGSLQQISDIGARGLGLRRLGLILRERAWLILLCVLLGGALANAYVWKAPRTYTASTIVKYQAAQLRLLPIDKPLAETSAGALDEQIAALKRMLSSTSLLRQVVERQNLASLSEFSRGSTGDAGIDQAVQTLRSRLTISAPANDVVLTVTIADSDRTRCATLANAIAETLVRENSRERERLLRDVSAQLQSVLDRAREELKSETEALAQAALTTPAPTTPAPAETATLTANLQKLSEQSAAAEFELLQAEAAARAATGQGTNLDGLLQLPSVLAAPAVAAALARYQEQQTVCAGIDQRYRSKHPTYIQAHEQLDAARAQLALAVQSAVQDLQANRDRARQERDRLQRDYAAALATAQPGAPPDTAPNAAAPAHAPQVEAVRQFHDRLIESIKELSMTSELFINPLRIDQPAVAPLQPSGPNPYRTTAYGAAAGLLAGLLICLVFGLGDTSLRTVDEVERILGVPVLSVIPQLKDSDTELAAAEGFRSLRTSIAVSSKGKEPRMLLFTSTSPDEGKTFCALNFAVGLAQQGHKTVLIECDLRRPMAAPSLTSVRVDGPGVSDFLKGTAPAQTTSSPARKESGLSFAEIRRKHTAATSDQPDAAAPTLQPVSPSASVELEQILQRTEVANLFFIAAGKPVANPTELLSRPRLEQLLNSLLQHYDRIVIDSAPVLGVSETLLLSSKIQGLCFVIRGGHTPRRALVRAVEVLRRADAPILGAVLNGISPRRSDPYGQDYYYHRRD